MSDPVNKGASEERSGSNGTQGEGLSSSADRLTADHEGPRGTSGKTATESSLQGWPHWISRILMILVFLCLLLAAWVWVEIFRLAL